MAGRRPSIDPETLAERLAGKNLKEPPAATLRRAIALGTQLPTARGAIAWIVERLFDSARAPLPAGVRGGAITERRMLFRVTQPGTDAAGYELDLLCKKKANLTQIQGQILPPIPGAEVAIKVGRRRLEVAVSDDGDFSLPPFKLQGTGAKLEIRSERVQALDISIEPVSN